MKKMTINEDTQLSAIAAAFQKDFPFLSLRFYQHKHDSHQASPANEELEMPKSWKDVTSIETSERELIWADDWSVEKFEQYLEESFGLHVQVFRKSHGQWLQSWATDVWTLYEQNRRGEILGDKKM